TVRCAASPGSRTKRATSWDSCPTPSTLSKPVSAPRTAAGSTARDSSPQPCAPSSHADPPDIGQCPSPSRRTLTGRTLRQTGWPVRVGRVRAASVFGPVESDSGFQSAVRRVQGHRPRLVADDAVDIDLTPFLKAFDRRLGLGSEVSVDLTG